MNARRRLDRLDRWQQETDPAKPVRPLSHAERYARILAIAAGTDEAGKAKLSALLGRLWENGR